MATRRLRPDRFVHERDLVARGILRFAGIDEAGRGPLAGPVVAAAVVLPLAWILDGIPRDLEDLNDSKQIDEARRDEFFRLLTTMPGVEFAIAESSAEQIDALNILRATHRAMNEALQGLRPVPPHALVDGNRVPTLRCEHTPLVKGDGLSYSIAGASILAKVTRDRWMREAHERWPVYGFDQHKGYPTPMHLEAVARHGPCPIHRRSFAPIRRPAPELFPP
ncbi:MAG: ribonuclease HII [Verrucomicrobia bacterium]|nr:MAG: ribonuclease HII [Verrucomicrobiota bacterium]